MSINTETVIPLDRAPELGAGRSTLSRVVRRIARGTIRFVASLQAAQAVVRRAEYYYALSDQELARLGLTRQDVPTELLRELDRY